MKQGDELTLENFTVVTDHLFAAMEGINHLFTSQALSPAEKERLGKLGRTIHWAGHEIDHLFLDLKSLSDSLKEEIKTHYGH